MARTPTKPGQSIFPRPSGVVTTQATQAAAQDQPLVKTEDELRAAMGNPLRSIIRLGANISLRQSLPPVSRAVVIDGDGQYMLSTSVAMSFMFSTASVLDTLGIYTVPRGGLTLQGLTIEINHAVTNVVQVTTSFSSLVVRQLSFKVNAAVAKLFAVPLNCHYIDIDGVNAHVYNPAAASVTAAFGSYTGFAGCNGIRCSNWRTRNLTAFTNIAGACANCEFLGIRDDSIAMTFDVRCDNTRLIDFYGVATVDLRTGSNNALVGFICPAGGTPSPGVMYVNATDSAFGITGYTITAAAGALVQSIDYPETDDPWTIVVKTTTETIQSDSTLSNDTDLLFAMLANTTYRFRLRVNFQWLAASDFKYALVGPAAPTRVTLQTTRTIDGTSTPAIVASTSTYTASTTILLFALEPGIIFVDGIIENGANAGDFAFQWAQGTSAAENTSVLKGSYLEYSAL